MVKAPISAGFCRIFLSSTIVALGVSIFAGFEYASAYEFRTDYSATIRGFPVGSAKLRAAIEDERYEIRFSAKVGGLARLFSDMETSLAVSGELHEDGLRPETYEHSWREDDDEETAQIRFQAGSVREVAVEPPPRRPERRVPVSDDDLANVLDLASAFVWPAAVAADPEICNRTLPLFDGTQRFDLTFSFSRTAIFEARDGSYSGPAIVCAVRFRPISGHRRDRDTVTFMAENEEIEVWMVPAGDDLAVPAKIRVRTEHGLFALEAREFGAD